VFKQKYGIIINHKKIHRLRKELNLTRNYHRHSKHPKKRPKNHNITGPNQYWEADIKFVFTKTNGFVGILSIIDSFDRSIVGVYIGNSIKAKDFINTVKQAIEYRNATPQNLIIRTDNGPQFKANITDIFMSDLNITHEFGYKNNPNSQAFIESFHSSVQREFVEYITFNDIDDVYNYYMSYIYFYNHLRPHGSLKYLTPDFVFYLFNDNFNDFILSYDFSDFFVSVKK
ncbi:integrase, partial [Marinitoga sp. 1154]|uniref:IS3 family transposase n=1 Tax=Marinitoga sp. 1154 TaxID=1643335 RepID=UPI001586AA18